MYNGKRHVQPLRSGFSDDRQQLSMVHTPPMFAQPSPAYGAFSGHHTAALNANPRYFYGSQTNAATSNGPAFAQAGVSYMNYPYGAMAAPMVTVPMHMVQPQFIYGSTPQLHSMQQHPGFYMMQSSADHYSGHPAVPVKYKTVVSMRMGGSPNGLHSFASVPDLTALGNQDLRSMNGTTAASPLNLSDSSARVRSPNFDDSRSSEFQMRRANSEWNLKNAVVSEPGVTTPHPTSSKCRRRFTYGSNVQTNGAHGRRPRQDSFSSGFNSGESCAPAIDLDSTDPSLDVEVTIMGISPDGEADEQPKGDAQVPQFKIPQSKGRHRKINDRRFTGSQGPERR